MLYTGHTYTYTVCCLNIKLVIVSMYDPSCINQKTCHRHSIYTYIQLIFLHYNDYNKHYSEINNKFVSDTQLQDFFYSPPSIVCYKHFIQVTNTAVHIAMAEDEDKPISLDDIRSSNKSKLVYIHSIIIIVTSKTMLLTDVKVWLRFMQ